MAGHGFTSWQERLVSRVRAEPKRAAFLGVLLVVMGLMWFKALGSGGMQPSSASASATAAAAEMAAGPASDAPQLSRTATALLAWTRSPLPLVHRNLFDIHLEYFPRDGSTPGFVSQNTQEGFWDQVAKSLSNRADQQTARRILVENLQAQASRLDLQSTVMNNGTPKALINGILAEEGDVVGGFRILTIEARRIIVERSGVKLEVLFNFK